MAGTRYNARGVDEEGNAANFVETEMIVECPFINTLYSHVQVRGSVPVFWSQKTKKNKVVISNVSEMIVERAFDAHMQDLMRNYKLIVFLNLLSKEKQQEVILSKKITDLIEKFAYDRVKKFQFDFHYETSGDNFGQLDQLITIIKNSILNNFGYFILNKATGNTELQKGVYRTNCLDCLDRTNVT